jgi:hypothetical protein
VTVPGLTPMQLKDWPWYWSFTGPALCQLLEDRFDRDAVSVEVYGNIFVATAFLYGLALEELEVSVLDVNDAKYPVIVAARAIKQKDA